MNQDNTANIKPLPKWTGIADKVMYPLMVLLAGFAKDSIQETHAWHVQDHNPSSIDRSGNMVVEDKGISNSWINHQKFGLFHVPIIGGWKDYIVLEADTNNSWYLGWHVVESSTNKTIFCQINRLELTEPRVKVLSGPAGGKVTFFGYSADGVQIPLKLVDRGEQGDLKYKHLRLL